MGPVIRLIACSCLPYCPFSRLLFCLSYQFVLFSILSPVYTYLIVHSAAHILGPVILLIARSCLPCCLPCRLLSRLLFYLSYHLLCCPSCRLHLPYRLLCCSHCWSCCPLCCSFLSALSFTLAPALLLVLSSISFPSCHPLCFLFCRPSTPTVSFIYYPHSVSCYPSYCSFLLSVVRPVVCSVACSFAYPIIRSVAHLVVRLLSCRVVRPHLPRRSPC